MDESTRTIQTKINDAGLGLIKSFESLKLIAYICPAGVLTIGYGSTGDHVKAGMRIMEVEAEALLRRDVGRFEKGMIDLIKVPLTSNEFSALISWSFNVGLEAAKTSTLMRYVNSGKNNLAADQFMRWTKAAGRELPGLVRRRRAERELFLKPDAVIEAPAHST